jgi:hypothetical protein
MKFESFQLWPIQKGPSRPQIFLIKYGFEYLESMNDFLYRNVTRFEMNFELKIWELKVCFRL